MRKFSSANLQKNTFCHLWSDYLQAMRSNPAEFHSNLSKQPPNENRDNRRSRNSAMFRIPLDRKHSANWDFFASLVNTPGKCSPPVVGFWLSSFVMAGPALINWWSVSVRYCDIHASQEWTIDTHVFHAELFIIDCYRYFFVSNTAEAEVTAQMNCFGLEVWNRAPRL